MIAGVLIVAAMLAQVVLVNRLGLPFGAVPDLVLLVIVGFGVVRGSVPGAVVGFCAGLVTDLLPPAAHAAGQYALVYALAGFFAGRAEEGKSSPVLTAVVCGVAGPLVAAGAGALLGDPRITLTTMAAELPPAMVGNLLAAPLVVLCVMRLLARPGDGAVRRPLTHTLSSGRT